MRKDYIPVVEAAVTDDEMSFVARYWTDVWKTHAQPQDLSALARREEYRIIRPFLAKLAPGNRILDGGCGLGEWTAFFAQQGFDAESLAAYFSWGAFEHFENGLGDCLAEACRILRPDGWLFISVPFDNWRHILRDSRPLERWHEGFDPEAGYRQTHRFYQWRLTRPELRRELELHGFRTEIVTPISKLQGVGRWLQWDFRVFRPNTRAYFAARRAFAALMPTAYVSHMLLAVAERR
ncbi:MAG: methyltransferase domain-containing protein [Acidobacteria bacterium]|nr:methyltransferase domain-containing protein [Acidobacteriota bacterium]